MRDIENQRAISSDFYEELCVHTTNLKTSEKEGSGSLEERKNRFKRIGVLLDELQEIYWDLTDLLTELEGIEILETNLPEKGIQLSRALIQLLKQMGPTVSNAHKSLRSSELGSLVTDLYIGVNDSKFKELDDILKNLLNIDRSKLVYLKHKRIL
jgi:hypothetical protein